MTLQSFAMQSIPPDGRYVLCNVTRLPQLRELREMLTQIVAAGKQHNLRFVLFNVFTMNTPFSIMQAFSFGDTMAEIFPPEFRVAALVRDMVPNRHFVETVTVNRGRYFRYFTDCEQALIWMLGAP